MKGSVMMTYRRQGRRRPMAASPYGHCWPREKKQGIAHGSDISL